MTSVDISRVSIEAELHYKAGIGIPGSRTQYMPRRSTITQDVKRTGPPRALG